MPPELAYLTASAGLFWGLSVLLAGRSKLLATALALFGATSAVLAIVMTYLANQQALSSPLALLVMAGQWVVMWLAYRRVAEVIEGPQSPGRI